MIVKRLDDAERELKKAQRMISILEKDLYNKDKTLDGYRQSYGYDFVIVNVRDWSVKFKINDLTFIWRNVADHSSKSVIDLFVVDSNGFYKILDLGKECITWSTPCFNKKSGQTHRSLYWRVEERLIKEISLEKLYNIGIQRLKQYELEIQEKKEKKKFDW